MTLATLRHAAYAADAAYSSELRRVYGRNAGTARYRPRHSDPGCEAASVAKLLADDALHKAWEADTARVKAETPVLRSGAVRVLP